MCFYNGGSNGLRRCLASSVTRRVRFPRLPPICISGVMAAPRSPKPSVKVRVLGGTPIFISVKCYQVALAVWGGKVQVRILARRPFSPYWYNGITPVL